MNELRILHGLPIELGAIVVHPLTLDEIAKIGEDEFNKLLNIVRFKDSNLEFQNRRLTHFESALLYCHRQEEFRELFLNAFGFFLREPVHFSEQGFFYVGDLQDGRLIGEELFNEIQTIIKKQNFLKETQEKEFKPHNDKAKALIEKRKEILQKIHKQNNEDGLSLSDIISIVSAYSPSINIFNVWDLTVFQLYTLYMRLIMKDNYESNFYLLPHSSDPKSLELKHWATKIKE